MISCRRACRWLERALDGELSLDQEFALDEHIAHCERCRGRRGEWEQLELLFDRQPEPATDRVDLESAVRGVRARVDAAGLEVGSGGRWVRRSGPMRVEFGRRVRVAAAAVLFGVALGFAWTGDWGRGAVQEGSSDGPEVAAGRDTKPAVAGGGTSDSERDSGASPGGDVPGSEASDGVASDGGASNGANGRIVVPGPGALAAGDGVGGRAPNILRWPSVEDAPPSAIEALPRAVGSSDSRRRDEVVADLRVALLGAFEALESGSLEPGLPGAVPAGSGQSRSPGTLGVGGGAVPSVERFVELVDSDTAQHGRWPRERLVSGLLADLIEERDSDASPSGSAPRQERERLIAASARYLGVRGDAVSRRRLGEALTSLEGSVDGTAGKSLVAAILEGGDAGWAELEPRLIEPALRREVLEQLSGHPLEDRLRWLTSALSHRDLRRAPAVDPGDGEGGQLLRRWLDQRDDLAKSLGACGTPAVDVLLDFVESGEFEAELLFGDYTWDAESVAVLTARARDLTRGGSVAGMRMETLRRGRALLEVISASCPPGPLDWVLGYFEDDALRGQALGTVASLDGGAAVDLVVKLWARRLVGDEELPPSLRDLLARNSSVVLDRVRSALEDGAVGDALDLCELCVAARHASMAPALIELCGSRLLPSEERMLAAESVGEVGRERDAQGLTANLRNLSRGERRVAALCLVSAHALAGDDAVREALAGASPQLISQVLSMLHRRGAPGRSAASLVQLSRALEPILESRRTQPRRTDL